MVAAVLNEIAISEDHLQTVAACNFAAAVLDAVMTQCHEHVSHHATSTAVTVLVNETSHLALELGGFELYGPDGAVQPAAKAEFEEGVRSAVCKDLLGACSAVLNEPPGSAAAQRRRSHDRKQQLDRHTSALVAERSDSGGDAHTADVTLTRTYDASSAGAHSNVSTLISDAMGQLGAPLSSRTGDRAISCSACPLP